MLLAVQDSMLMQALTLARAALALQIGAGMCYCHCTDRTGPLSC